MCPGWEQFLERVVQLKFSIKLTTLEFQASDSLLSEFDGDDSLQGFLGAFEGLEELFICQPGPIQAPLRLWECISGRHETIKRFVHHQRTIDTDEESASFEEGCDIPDLSIFGRDMRRIRDDPSQNSLGGLDLNLLD